MHALELIDTWEVPHAAAAVVGPSGIVASHGDATRSYRLASVSKLMAAYAGLVALEEGSIDLDEPAGREGATVRHLLAHAAGYAFDGDEPVAGVERKRIYSNTGIELFAAHLADRTQMSYGDYLREAVFAPLGMAHTVLKGSAAYAVHSTLADTCRFAQEVLAPTLISRDTFAVAVRVQFPGLPGIIPGVGRFDPCDWGIGFELNAGRPGHWTGTEISRRSYGHFGGSGTFLIADPDLDRAIVCLTDREYGPWALQAWPVFCDTVVRELRVAA